MDNLLLENNASGVIETIISIVVAVVIIAFLIWAFWLNLIPKMQETLQKP